MATYGQRIQWTRKDGGVQAVEVEGYASPQEAMEAAFQSAIRWGWTRPRWWQWWRYDDIDYTKYLNRKVRP